MNSSTQTFAQRVRPEESAGTLIIFHSDPRALIRQAKEYEQRGYDVYPVVVTSAETKAAYCDSTGKIIKFHPDGEVFPGFVDRHGNLFGNFMVSSRDDVMQLMAQIKPDAMISLNTYGYGAGWADEGVVMDAAKTMAPMIPKVVDMGVKSTQISASIHEQARQGGFSILDSYEYDAADALIKSAIAAQRGRG